MFPGRSCPGLIEAASRNERPRPRLRSFRGEAAPASLKPARADDPRATLLLAFPGRSCPGLIEARRPTSLQSSSPRVSFRGEAAPASLKRGQLLGHALGVRAGFRGEAAPASLKHDAEELDSGITNSFRGEAAPASLKRGRVGALSPPRSRFPGRSCPGLIEAGGCRGPSRPLPSRFRGEAAPASLKPLVEGQHGFGTRLPCFRGEAAPASLKPSACNGMTVVHGHVSGAKLPRPH